MYITSFKQGDASASITTASPIHLDNRFMPRSSKVKSTHDFFVNDNDKSFRSSSESNTKNKKQQQSKISNKAQAIQVSDLAVPVPDTRAQSISVRIPISSYTPSRTTLQFFITTTPPTPVTLAEPSPVSTSFSTTFSATPLKLSSTVISAASTSSLVSHTAAALPNSSATPTNPSQRSSASHKLPVAIIVAMTVGFVFLLAGVFVAIKAYSRPTRRARPKPSLPILDDAFDDDDLYKSKESPVFGGKERFSSQPGTGGVPWTWTQYPVGTTAVISPPSDGTRTCVAEISQAVSSGDVGSKQNNGLFQDVPVLDPSPAPLRNSLQQVLNKVTNRSSIAKSVSVYPNSPACIVGEAANDGKIFTADGHNLIRRESRAALRRSRSNTLDEAGSRMSILATNSQELLAYDGAAIQSPQFLAHFQAAPPSATPGGRSRIKSSYYTPGSYPRISSLPSSTTKMKVNDVTEEFNIQQLPPIHRTSSCRDRETKALTSALGLASPPLDTIPLSPQPTIYPDDSLSVIDTTKSQKRLYKKLAPICNQDSPEQIVMSPTMDTSTALGSLMLMDFGTTSKSLATLAGHLGESIDSSSTGSKYVKTTLEKPPRVPSPPPLPSLAQMGLKHINPDAYDDYRSPTYSIFGLYGEDRRSRMSLHSRTG